MGGDAKYLCDLVNTLTPGTLHVSIATDVNPSFETFVAHSLTVPTPIEYLDTRPRLFKKSWVDCSGRYVRATCRALLLSRLRECIWNFFLFYRLLKKNGAKVDILHFNNGGYPAKEAGLMAIFAAGLLGKKVMMSFHNMPVKRSLLRPSDYVFDYLVSRYCDCVIAASEALKEAIVRERKLSPHKVHTIYCGLPDEAPLSQEDALVLRRQLNGGTAAPVLIICGNLDEDRKGHAPLLRALAIVKAQFPDVVLWVVGKGSPERVQHLKSLAGSLGLEQAVRFLGFRKDVHALNSAADVAVVPSLFTEATPYTIKEAARASRPVVTTAVGGCAEAVVVGETGFVVPPNDVMALADAIIRLLRDPELCLRMGRKARELFLQKFLLSEKVKQHEMIYAQLRGVQ